MTDAPAALTIEDAADWTMREVAHYNGGKEWFGYGHRCYQQPRLYRLDRYARKDRSVTSTWSVDGEDCVDLADAINRLNSDPVVGPDELRMLAALAPAFQPLKEVRATEPYLSMDHGVLHHWLPRKGLAEAENGYVRRTELGTRILAQGIEAGTVETPQEVQPEGQEPGGEAMRPTESSS